MDASVVGDGSVAVGLMPVTALGIAAGINHSAHLQWVSACVVTEW